MLRHLLSIHFLKKKVHEQCAQHKLDSREVTRYAKEKLSHLYPQNIYRPMF